MERYGRIRRESGGVTAKGAPGIGLALTRGVDGPNRILSRRGRHGSADSFIGLTPAPADFWGRGCGRVFGPKPKNHAGGILGAVLGPPVEML
jgi:hypothetical protein